MKRTRSIFALLAALVLALALVPGMAWGVEGTLGGSGTTDKGKITIGNSRDGETYSVYKLFDLASFTDSNPATGSHESDSEAYSYVIDLAKDANNNYTNKWATFLLNYGADGSTDASKPYAKLTSDSNSTATEGQIFWIEADPITINNGNGTSTSTYHVIYPTSNFTSALDDTDPETIRTGDGEGAADGTSDGTNYATSTNAIVQNFAQEAIKFANEQNLNPSATLPNEGSYVATNLDLGYYVVGTTMGTLASLDTTNNEVIIYEKNDEPSIEKDVLVKGGSIPALTADGLTGRTGWVANTDADFEDYVLFRTVVTAQQGAKNYKIHDVMEAGLELVSTAPSSTISNNDYNGTVSSYLPKVYLVRGSNAYFVPASSDSYTNYTFSTTTTDKCDFEILFSDAGGSGYGNDLVQLATQDTNESGSVTLHDIQDGDKIVVLYWAKVVDGVEDVWGREVSDGDSNKTTVATANNTQLSTQKNYEHDGNGRNDNHTVLTYGNASYTTWSTASVTSYGFDIAKTKPANTDGVGANNYTMLDGAHFELYKASKTSTDLVTGGITFTPNGESAPYYQSSKALMFTAGDSNYYSYDGDTATGGASTVTDLVSKDGKAIELTGLEAGNYLLVETKAPTGYNKLAHPLVVTITGDADNNASGNPTAPDNNEGTITYVFSPNSSAAAETTTNGGWKSIVTAAAGEAPAYYPKYAVEADNSDPENPVTAVDNGGVHIVNQTGTELPSTGGLGTKGFVAIGGSLFAASVLFLYTKKRLARAA